MRKAQIFILFITCIWGLLCSRFLLNKKNKVTDNAYIMFLTNKNLKIMFIIVAVYTNFLEGYSNSTAMGR